MNKKDLLIGLLIIVGVMLLLAHCTMIKNIDLTWNIKHFDYDDCNGFICQDAVTMYNHAVMYMFALEPVLLSIYFVFVFWVSRWEM